VKAFELPLSPAHIAGLDKVVVVEDHFGFSAGGPIPSSVRMIKVFFPPCLPCVSTG